MTTIIPALSTLCWHYSHLWLSDRLDRCLETKDCHPTSNPDQGHQYTPLVGSRSAGFLLITRGSFQDDRPSPASRPISIDLTISILKDRHSFEYIPFSSRRSYRDTFDTAKIVQLDATFNDEAYKAYCHLDISTMFTISYGLSFVNATITITRIQVDQNRYDRANVCTLWNAFASRGLDVNAVN
ncbi:hypothetical protein ARMGADRAFT_1077809 [Armillaria gallica]|uniref:Extracellular metalloproteinase n=1 Tax=Armillaria gallica TaxID=47427 RepID=A0A2H3E128_ARMGA|nr:hypothetical protein ARMGADRAFT_1077809 [Armillaria gallica]